MKKNDLRRKIFGLVEVEQAGDKRIFDWYDVIMVALIVISLVPLAFKQTNTLFLVIDKITAAAFIVDYLLRLATADYKLGKGKASFFLYPFTFMALVDLVSILPSFRVLSSGFRLLRLLRMARMLRVFRALKLFRYSRNITIIASVIRSQRAPLLAVGTLAAGYIIVSALVVFNVEPDTFGNFFDAVYWATVSLTTMGYGDIYPITDAGRIVTILSSFIGIAIVALPSGIITAGYMDEIRKDRREHEDSDLLE